MQKGQEGERQRKETRGFGGQEDSGELCAVHLENLFMGAKSSMGSRAGKVSWDQMAGVWTASPPRSVGF